MSFKSPSEIQVTSRQIPKWERIPNTSIQSKPLMIYHKAFSASPNQLTTHLEEVGEVTPQWVYSISGVVSGRARLCFGGEGNPNRFDTIVEKGDLIIVPAGVGHRLLDELDTEEERFKMVGAYPKQKQWDMCYGQSGEEDKVKGIKDLGWFHKDPLFGDDGPVLHV
ncbi:cupin domain-containing protein [Aspergillus novofumigatus IBT 16806]|uniref:Cupin domain protein n=1 Tax=Aspergillus novofumigatus (strain IBT 16806) TaxID=1392255 RepID=A0A2I1C8X0_ASPN1|nr:cupin domain protein [Aspergillus novofumigatus IBT 16806]PKX94070.1 cupin domain protein [Aspergillus novofumigatus IBT 16806]